MANEMLDVNLQNEAGEEETRLLDEDANLGEEDEEGFEMRRMDTGTALTRGSMFDPAGDFSTLDMEKSAQEHSRRYRCWNFCRISTLHCNLQGPAKDRLAMLAGMVLLFFVVVPGLFHHFGKEMKVTNMSKELREMGFGGVFVFTGMFTLGQIIRIPGVIFLIIGNVTYGRLWGWVINMASLPFVLAASFFLFRKIGGQPLQEISSPFVKRMMDKLQESPLQVVVVLRLCFMLLPFVNLLLALSPVTFKHYMLGSVLGLIPLVTLVAVFTETAFKFSEWIA
mmetsp:Transcript_14158/g.23963  ORF Transcript_14158/g.23963 Transcript_14158/m.23963 type:complete len:281 (-) Transcript_14158:390-1232(-)